MSKDKNTCTDLGLISDVVCEYFNIDKVDLFKKTRQREIVFKRQMFYYQSRKWNPKFEVGLHTIGLYYSDVTNNIFDHAAVYHSCNKIKNLMDVYPSVVLYESEISELIKKRKETAKKTDGIAIRLQSSVEKIKTE